MYWQEDTDETGFVVPDNVIDLAFSITCQALPVDHAQALYTAVAGVLSWLADEAGAGIHTIHGADSGNGWERPEDVLLLSRRTKLVLRLPKARVEAARALTGQCIDVAGHAMEIGEAQPRQLSKSGTLYARYVSIEAPGDEEVFLHTCVAELREQGIRAKKFLCGKTTTLHTDAGPLETRSLMVADLSLEDSVRLQEHGVGAHRHLGCGLFIASKAV
ncbi:MAG: type I-MYXAN CRISPR-associated protein Cas6/Cmx6 [Gammaproteobacteria bacterium]|nr:type I-MYXAN CRISPR-associated protein Cas6/Cmx6 [Gammaproteobacteria bacterium]